MLNLSIDGKKSISIKFALFLLTSFALTWSDLFNTVLAATPLVAWKQLCIVLLGATTLLTPSRREGVRLGVIWLSLECLLVAYTAIVNGDISWALFNSFFYTSWIIAAAATLNFGGSALLEISPRHFVILIIASVLGLYLDGFTSIFSFLPKAEEYYLNSGDALGIARRAAFFFPTSTMVAPILIALAELSIILGANRTERKIVIAAVAISFVPTGSFSAAMICAIYVLLRAVLLPAIATGHVLTYSAVTACVLLLMPISYIDTDNSDIAQLSRIFNNIDDQSEANIERRELVSWAMLEIGHFSVGEHIVGLGIGSTNSRFDIPALYPHGESSFIQSHIELGLLGDALRLIPIVILMTQRPKSKKYEVFRSSFMIFGSLSLFATFTAPTFGAIPFQFMLGIFIGLLFKANNS